MKTLGARKVWAGIALCCAALFVVAVAAIGQVGGADSPSDPDPDSTLALGSDSTSGADPDSSSSLVSDSSSGVDPDSPSGGKIPWVSTQERVLRGEALPCTGPKDPINFEIFSAGSEVAGLPLVGTSRRCDSASPADESPSNRITYMYGDCDATESETGCAPPLQVQTWPACMRNQAGYSFEGKPLPYRELASSGGAKVVEFDFMGEKRIEVYTKDSTIVIFAIDPELARKAVELLIPQEIGKPPVTSQSELQGDNPPQGLGAPSDGAIEGELQCTS